MLSLYCWNLCFDFQCDRTTRCKPARRFVGVPLVCTPERCQSRLFHRWLHLRLPALRERPRLAVVVAVAVVVVVVAVAAAVAAIVLVQSGLRMVDSFCLSSKPKSFGVVSNVWLLYSCYFDPNENGDLRFERLFRSTRLFLVAFGESHRRRPFVVILNFPRTEKWRGWMEFEKTALVIRQSSHKNIRTSSFRFLLSST